MLFLWEVKLIATSRIGTYVANSISYNGNHYANALKYNCNNYESEGIKTSKSVFIS